MDEGAAPPPPDRLVADPLPLVGRGHDLNRLARLLRARSAPVITLTGIGGIGKTRLATEVVARLATDLPSTVVPLAAVADHRLILSAIAAALGGEMPAQGDMTDPAERVIAALGGNPALVLLDNLEHLPGAAGVLAPVIARSPGTRWLLTSRSPIGLPDEQIVPLIPLAVEPSRRGGGTGPALPPAVRLFDAAARRAAPSFRVTEANDDAIRQVCQRLLGLPLALELAGARAATFGPRTMLDILDRPAGTLDLLGDSTDHDPGDRAASDAERHRTLRRTLRWSVDLLDEPAAAVFRHLGVFPADFSTAAAAAVADRPVDDVAALLTDLARANLLVALPVAGDAPPRHTMAPPIRELARELLAADPAAIRATRRRLVAWAVDFVAERRAAWRTSDTADWLRSVEADLATIRAATAIALDDGDPASAIALLTPVVWQVLGTRGRLADEGATIDTVMAAAERADPPVPPDLLGRGYSAQAIRAQGMGLIPAAIRAAEHALSVQRANAPAAETAMTLNTLGLMELDHGSLDRARTHFQESLALRRPLGHLRTTAIGLINLSEVARRQGDLATAREQVSEVLALAEPAGDDFLAGSAYLSLSEIALAEGDATAALTLARRALALLRAIDERRMVGQALGAIGRAARRAGQPGEAVRSLTEALATQHARGDAAMAATELDELADLLAGPAGAAGAAAPAAAITLLGAAAALRERAGAPVPGETTARIAALRAAWPGAGFLIPWSEGRQVPPDSLVETATRLGDAWLSTRLQSGDAAGSPPVSPDSTLGQSLTARERDVLRWLAAGLSDPKIADALGIGAQTVSTHVSRILRKLDVPSRTAATAVALRHGLIDAGQSDPGVARARDPDE